MSNIVIIGKDLPDNLELAESYAAKGKTVFVTSKSEAETAKFESENIYATTWNKASAISAHSLIIKAETKLTDIEEVLFYFDAYHFASKFELDKSEEIANAVDSMINSYLYASCELLKRIDQIKDNTFVSFLIREYPSKCESLSSKIPVNTPANTVVSAAQSAFISIAESFATNIADRPYLNVFLAKCPFNNELYKNEKAIAEWMCDSVEAIKGLKKPLNVKQAATWNKVGGKVSTGFSLFR